MLKAKILLGLACMVCTMAVAVTPALAEFSSTTTKGTGTSGLSEFSTSAGVITSSKDTVEWKIRTLTKQEAAVKGAHLNLGVKFEQVSVPAIGSVPNVECELQLAQPGTGKSTATASVLSPCVIKIEAVVPGCTITVPVASGVKNSALTKNAEVNVGTGLEIQAADGGVTTVISEACKAAGLTPGETSTATLKGTEKLANIKFV